MKRRSFLKKSVQSSASLAATSLLANSLLAGCTNETKKQKLKISLAQWSLNRQFFGGQLDAREFARIASETYGIDAIEYVNGFYMDEGENEQFWNQMRFKSDDHGVTNLLIMVDDEGDLGHTSDDERKQSVENHFKWVNAAKLLGCHSIRVNAFGEGSEPAVRAALVDGMGQLSEYAAQEEINVLIENHGLFSSNGKLIAGIIKEVDKPNFGSLPDFGNWCLSAKWGSTQIPCDKAYDRYEGVTDLLPYAKSVSAKSYDFDEAGDETRIDYYKMLKIVKGSRYNGYIGIEYEGERLSEHDGILATKALIEKAWSIV